MRYLYTAFFRTTSLVMFIAFLVVPWNSYGQLSFEAPRAIAPNVVDVDRPFVTDIDGNGVLDVILGSRGSGRIVAFEFNGDTLQNGRELIGGDVRRYQCRYADINGDGLMDIITGRFEPGQPRSALYLNDGHGKFGDPIPLNGGPVYDDWQIVTGDLTGDGADEIILIYGSTVKAWHYDDNSHSLELMATFNGNGDWKGAAVADLNNDGVNELLLSKWHWIGYWEPNTGGFSLVTIEEGTGLLRFLPADLNSDGRMDLVTYSTTGFGARLQQSNGTFLGGATGYFGGHLMDIQAVDSDGDGLTEIWGAAQPGIIRFNLGPDGSVNSTDTLILDWSNLDRFLIDDVQGDGIPDVLLVTTDDRLMLWEGSPGPVYDLAPRVLFEWPHDLAISPITLPNGADRQDLGLATGTISSYYGSIRSTSHFYIVPPDGNGLDALDHYFLANDQWFEPSGENMITADLDQDGDVDILGCYTSSFSPCKVYGLENDQSQFTNHCFASEIDQFLQTAIRKVDAFDVNGDGYLDLHVRGSYSHYPAPPNPPWYEMFDTFLIHAGPWEFTAAATSLPSTYYWNHADLDGDGLEDLVVTEGATPQLVVYKNLGQGQYLASASAPFDVAAGSIGASISFADMDSDGRPDLFRTSHDSNIYTLRYQRLSTDVISDPVLLYEQLDGVNLGTYAIPADIDHDGWMDLLVVDRPSYYAYTWTIFLGDGTFPFHDGVLIYQGRTPYEPFLYDEDGDGDLDLVMRFGPCLYSMKNITPRPLISTGSSSVYPNPSTGEIVVDLGYNGNDELQVDVFDAAGRMVLSSTRTATVFSMDLRAFGQGVYLLRISSKVTGAPIKQVRVVLLDQQ